ncbi:MAG TPA: nitroreductase family protein [Candidatus Acidoferrales bacterium]|nr:nitroreductase family protein [Candidatus Acidoferrales bacterium]
MPERKRPAPSAVPVHDVISHRWSPRAFEPRAIPPRELKCLFEAARWAASSYNAQPWYYIVATKDEPENFQKVLSTFVEFNQGWAKNASAVALSVAAHKMPHDGSQNRHAFHDVGAASATLALEATSHGFQVHQMAGILPDKAREVFGIPPDFEAVAGFAIGYPGDPMTLPEGRLRDNETGTRQRKPLTDFVFTGKWGNVSPIVK